MKIRHAAILAFLGVTLLSAASSAQTKPLKFYSKPVDLTTQPLHNQTAAAQLVFDDVLVGDGAPWIRVRFGRAVLQAGSYVVLTSLQDGDYQILDAQSMAEWYNHSAYFNGDAVQVSLYAGAGTQDNQLDVAELILGEWEPGDGGVASQCGPTDDRVASTAPERARLLNIGCTASLFSDTNCFISAGHCTESLANTVEFDVPLSQSNGTIVHPPASEQYSVDQASRQWVNGGVGNDWGLFKVFNNSTTGLNPFQAQGAHLTLASAMPALPETIDLVGYGVDTGSANQTQQRGSGPVTSISGSTLNHQADTTGGNSGSSILSEASQVIAIHTHAGCSTGGSGSNSSTAITNSGLQAALATFCAGGGGGEPTCAEIASVRVRCKRGTLRVTVTLTNSTHNGQMITINVDGVNQVLTINGSQASFILGGQTGSHTVSLVTPAGCPNTQTVTCN